MKRPGAVRLALAAAVLAVLAADRPVFAEDLDAQRSAWRARRTVSAQEPGRLVALPLEPEVQGAAQREGRDLRLLDASGAEVPFLLDRLEAREARTAYAGHVVAADARREQQSLVEVDLGSIVEVDTFEVEIAARRFAKRVRLETSEDGATWTTRLAAASLFGREWSGGFVRHVMLELPAAVRARRVRLTLDDTRSEPVNVTGLTATRRLALAAQRFSREASLVPLGRQDGVSRYALELPAAIDFDELTLAAEDALFARRVKLIEEQETGGRIAREVRGEALVYRVAEGDLAGASLTLPVAGLAAGRRVLEVVDGDAPALRRLQAKVSGPRARLVYVAPDGGLGAEGTGDGLRPAAEPAGRLVLYYGNRVVRAPDYGLEPLRARLAAAGELPIAVLGEEEANPRFREAPPLQFAARPGTTVEVARFRYERRVGVPVKEDLYSLTLAATDLGLLRSDLADLRLVDAEARQVPFVLEPGVREEPVILESEALEAPTGRSRWRFSVPRGDQRPRPALPLTALELRAAEGFFSRTARVLMARPDGRGGEVVVWAGRLERRAGGAEEPVRLPVSTRAGELVLEIEDGDDAPLTLSDARALVRVPRIAFKAAGGELRLLMGDPEATAPRYDLAALRAEVLAWSAERVEATPAEPSVAHRRGWRELLGQAPPTLLLWGTLLAAAVALIALTLRLAGQPNAPRD
ncbi:MAG: hypothetical protein NDJ94_21125 [Vicinamibacteria bacterium]|nr:hypothetical protein [Vicinamibacteria bacterium]